MKGRNTTCITIRLPDSVVQSLTEKALEAGMGSPGEYIKAQLMKSYSAIAMDVRQEDVLSLAAQGLTKEAIASQIGRSVRTVQRLLPVERNSPLVACPDASHDGSLATIDL